MFPRYTQKKIYQENQFQSLTQIFRIAQFLRAWIHACYTDFKKPASTEDVLAFTSQFSTTYVNEIKLAFIRVEIFYLRKKEQNLL